MSLPEGAPDPRTGAGGQGRGRRTGGGVESWWERDLIFAD